MQRIEKYKDVTIEGREFRIARIPAIQGTWIAQTMAIGIGNMEQETYSKMQQQWLEAVSVYREDKTGVKVPMKVFSAGKWMAPDLGIEDDLELIYQLFDAVTDFNFSDFFRKCVLEIQAETSALSETAA